jgi:hypothetical protein
VDRRAGAAASHASAVDGRTAKKNHLNLQKPLPLLEKMVYNK